MTASELMIQSIDFADLWIGEWDKSTWMVQCPLSSQCDVHLPAVWETGLGMLNYLLVASETSRKVVLPGLSDYPLSETDEAINERRQIPF